MRHEEGVFDPVARWSEVAGDRRAIIDVARDRVVTYAQLHADAGQWVRLLDAHGVEPGDRIGILAQNRYEFLPLFIACLRVGAVLVPFNWRLAVPELAGVMQHAHPMLLFTEARFAQVAMEMAAACDSSAPAARVLDCDHDVPAWFASGHEHHQPRAHTLNATVPNARTLAMLLYTSGTTGAPKGVMVSHGQLHWNAVSTTLGWSLEAGDLAAVATPLFHTAAWHVFMTPLLHAGGCVAMLPSFDAASFLSTLARLGVTRAFCVPTQLYRLEQSAEWGRAVPSLRQFISGGAPLPSRLMLAARAAGYPVRDAYGITECGPNCFVISDEALARDPHRVGWPLPFVNMRVVGDDGCVQPPGTVGELQLQAPQLFSGYFRDDTITAAAFTADGWLRTGDNAAMHADGSYRLVGRIKDLFISGGENVYPGEVEAALAHCSGVHEAVVVGVPDEVWGEVGCAVIVPAERGARAEDILAQLRQRLAGYKVPHSVRFVAALPTLGSGKVDRQAVRSLAFTARRGED